MEEKKWKIENKQFWLKTENLETVRLFYSQTEKALNSCILVSDVLDKKADSINLRATMFMIGIIGFLATIDEKSFYIHFLVFVFCPLILAVLKAKSITDPTGQEFIGYPPERLIVSNFTKSEEKASEKYMLLFLCERYNRRILNQEKINAKKAGKISQASNLLSIITPFMGLFFVSLDTFIHTAPIQNIIVSIITLFVIGLFVALFLDYIIDRFVRN